MKHTPGPWRFKLKNAGNGFLVISADENHICDVHMTNLRSVAEDRARLIAAAPALLEACKRSLEVARSWHDNHGTTIECDLLCDTIPQLKAALTKATGETK